MNYTEANTGKYYIVNLLVSGLFLFSVTDSLSDCELLWLKQDGGNNLQMHKYSCLAHKHLCTQTHTHTHTQDSFIVWDQHTHSLLKCQNISLKWSINIINHAFWLKTQCLVTHTCFSFFLHFTNQLLTRFI